VLRRASCQIRHSSHIRLLDLGKAGGSGFVEIPLRVGPKHLFRVDKVGGEGGRLASRAAHTHSVHTVCCHALRVAKFTGCY
jgi:hypothetical protein